MTPLEAGAYKSCSYNKKWPHVILLFLFGVYLMLFPLLVGATEFTSASFKVIDPIISVGGGRSTSASFGVDQAVGQPIVGNPTSASFGIRSGFLTFSAPSVVQAVVETAEATVVAVGGGGLLLSLLRAPKIVGCPQGLKIADLNCDGAVGLQDLSIFLYYFPRIASNPVDLNKDKVVDIKDLSVLLYSWDQRLLTFLPDSLSLAESVVAEIQPQEQFAFVGGAVPVSISVPGEELKISLKQKVFSVLRDTVSFIYEIPLRVFRLFKSLFWQSL